MARSNQLALVSLRDVKKVSRVRKSPEPRKSYGKSIKKFEILHHPFNLNFRGRIGKWLTVLGKENIDYKQILERNEVGMFRMYFFPTRDKRWLTQEQVAKRIKSATKSNVRVTLVSSLLTLWEAERN